VRSTVAHEPAALGFQPAFRLNATQLAHRAAILDLMMMRCRENIAMKSADHEASAERWSLTRRGAELLLQRPASPQYAAEGPFEPEHLLEISLQSLIVRESVAAANGYRSRSQ
jgi:hypothetical protein